MPEIAVNDFDVIRAMQETLHKEENEAAEAKLISDGTWETTLESYELMAPDRLPHAGVIGYRLCYNVSENGAMKRHWFNVYFTPVSNQKGLVLQSKLGAQLAAVVGMQEGDTFISLLERAKYTPVMQRISKKGASGGWKAGNTTWQISAVKVG